MRQPRSALRRAISLFAAAALGASMVSAGIVPAIAGTFRPTGAAAPVQALPAFLPNVTQFDVTGFLQTATLDGPGTGGHKGGHLTVNGQVVTVPAELVVFLPANMLTWAELFSGAPAPYGPTSTGMAMADLPQPISTYEVHVVGNRVGDEYIAGMVDISQNGLNSGAGYINYIDYATGQFEVGGLIGTRNTGTKVQLNDPLGRYGRVGGNSAGVSDDPRFTVDADNPTIQAGTGFPMCIPRTDPAVLDDALCPQTNRIPDAAGGFVISQTMTDPALLPLGGALDPRIQVPMEVGDYVNFSGNLVNTSATPITNVPSASTYVLAHTVGNNMAIYTAAGTNPAYVTIEVGLIGTGGLTVIGAGEAAIRTKFEGMTTDASRRIHLYGIDVNPDGTTSDRDWGFIGVDPGPAGGAGAVQGRWRFRPPCLAFGSVPTKPQTQCVYGPDGIFLPPTREVRAVIEGLQSQNPANVTVPPAPTDAQQAANGLFYGQYHAPIGEYIFPENIPGTPIVANNFEAIQFLKCGGFVSNGGTIPGQLNPWPGATAPTCLASPVANAGGPYTVNSGDAVALAGSATGSVPLNFSWAVPSAGTLSNRFIATPVFTAPQVAVATTINLSLTVTNTATPGTDTATTTVLVNPANAPVVDPIAAQTIESGSSGSFAVTGSDSNVPAHLPLTFAVTQAGPVTLTGLTVTQNGTTGANITYTAPTGVLTATDVTLSVKATNNGGVASAPVTTTVTVTPAPTGTPPVASAGGPYTVNSGSTVTLAGSATGTTPLTFLWATPAQGSISDVNVAGPVFTAPAVTADTTLNLSLTVTNAAGSSTATASVLVKAALPPTVAHVNPVSIASGANGSFVISGTDPNSPPQTPLTFTVTQTGSPALTGLTVAQNQACSPLVAGKTCAVVTFTAPVLPVAQVLPTVINLTITATNTLGQASLDEFTTVTVNPLADSVNITNAEYRTGKQRLIITATSNVISPNVILTLQPYVTTSGSTFIPPDGTFTNGGGGLYTITLVGAPQPAAGLVLQVKSNHGGTSPFHALDRVRA